MVDRQPRNLNRRDFLKIIGLTAAAGLLSTCDPAPVTLPVAKKTQTPVPNTPSATEAATAVPSATNPNVIKTPQPDAATATVTSTATAAVEKIPTWANGHSLQGEFAGVGGPGESITQIGLPDDDRLKQLVESGYQFVMDATGSVGKLVEFSSTGVKRIEAPALKTLAGEINNEVATFTRPDTFTTGAVEYTDPTGKQKMVFVNWYSANTEAKFAGIARKPNGLLAAVYLTPDGKTIEIAEHVFGPEAANISSSADAATNLVSIGGVVVVDANQPVAEQGFSVESLNFKVEVGTVTNIDTGFGQEQNKQIIVKPERNSELYDMGIEALVNSPSEGYWQALLGTPRPTEKQILGFAKNSQGPLGSYWLPPVDGQDIYFPSDRGHRRFGWQINPIVHANGVYIDGWATLVSGINPDVNGVLQVIKDANKPFETPKSDVGGKIYENGILIGQNGRMILVLASEVVGYPGVGISAQDTGVGDNKGRLLTMSDPAKVTAMTLIDLVWAPQQKTFMNYPVCIRSEDSGFCYYGPDKTTFYTADKITPEMMLFEVVDR